MEHALSGGQDALERNNVYLENADGGHSVNGPFSLRNFLPVLGLFSVVDLLSAILLAMLGFPISFKRSSQRIFWANQKLLGCPSILIRHLVYIYIYI